MNIASAIPIILAIFIFIENANVMLNILKFNTNGLSNPNSCPNDNHHSPFTFAAKSPNNPPITSPLKININNIFVYINIKK